jgi:four helix bundle protein
MRSIGFGKIECRRLELGTDIRNNEGKPMDYENLKRRTKKFALDVISLVESLPKDPTSRVLGGQLLRSGTSVGANYRAVCRAKSNADFISKFGIVEEEADESAYWLDLLVDARKLSSPIAAPLVQEAGELTAIAVSSIKTARSSGGRL